MSGTDISTAVSLLAGLSVASERLVEIVKGSIPFLNQQNNNPDKEGWRQATLHALAAAAGVTTALLATSAIQNAVPAEFSRMPGILVVGLLASGGSGFWNSILSYVKAAKDTKESGVPGPGQGPGPATKAAGAGK